MDLNFFHQLLKTLLPFVFIDQKLVISPPWMQEKLGLAGGTKSRQDLHSGGKESVVPALFSTTICQNPMHLNPQAKMLLTTCSYLPPSLTYSENCAFMQGMMNYDSKKYFLGVYSYMRLFNDIY